MTKQITLYLDLDGVVCDFQSAYEDRFDVQLNKVTEDIWETNWKTWVDEKFFERLKWYKGGRELIDHAIGLKKNGRIHRLEVLSASGGQPYHEEVVRQKTAWLKSRGLIRVFDQINIVESGKKKSDFAGDRTILVDDTYHVVDNFRKQGGVGLLHDGRVDDVFYQIDLSLKTFN
jgi:hypothetical protein